MLSNFAFVVLLITSFLNAFSYVKKAHKDAPTRSRALTTAFLTFYFSLAVVILYIMLDILKDALSILFFDTEFSGVYSEIITLVLSVLPITYFSRNNELTEKIDTLDPTMKKYVSVMYRSKVILPLVIIIVLFFVALKSTSQEEHVESTRSVTPTMAAQKSSRLVVSPTSPIPQKNYAQFENQLLDFDVPNDWETYDKQFARYSYYFRYPPNARIYDGDEESGPIEIVFDDKENQKLLINAAPYITSENTYKGGDLLEWFTKTIIVTKNEVNYKNTRYLTIQYDNGQTFYKIYEYADGRKESKHYFLGLSNGIPIELTDRNYNIFVSETVVLTILQTMRIN